MRWRAHGTIGVDMPSPSATSRGLVALTFAFSLSQFFRSCLAVIAPELQRDLALSPAGFGALSSSFFLAFAVAQVPVGVAFDRWGVGRPSRWLLAIGVVSAALLVAAPNGAVAMVAQAGLGLACAPVFMGLMHYAAEQLPPARFAAFISRANAVGMVGSLVATAPLGWAAHRIGWRPAIALGGVAMLLACIGVWRHVRDQGHAQAREESPAAMVLASAGLLQRKALWTLIPMCIAMAAGTSFRNAWGGPYFAQVFGLGADARGLALMAVSGGGILAALAIPLVVRRSSLRTTVAGWTAFSLAAALALTAWPAVGLALDLTLLTFVVTAGMLHPLVMSHGRELVPAALRGRGLGVLNTCVFLGSAGASWAFGLIAEAGQRRGWPVDASFAAIFGCAAALLLAGLLPYLFSPGLPRPAGAGRA